MRKALLLFSARGYNAVSVQEIVEEVGITKPTLYHYFGSKRGLLEDVLVGYFSAMNEALGRAAVYRGDLPLVLKQMGKALFEFARDYPTFYRFMLSLWFAPRESEGFQVVAGLNRDTYKVIERVFVEAVEQHGNMRGRHAAYALTFMGMINTYIGMSLNGIGELSDETLEKAVHQFQHGIYS